jgi:hypothetical protein
LPECYKLHTADDLQAGDVSFHTGTTFHYSGANTSPHARPALALAFIESGTYASLSRASVSLHSTSNLADRRFPFILPRRARDGSAANLALQSWVRAYHLCFCNGGVGFVCADFDVCGGVSAGAQIKSEKELHEGMLQNDRQSWVRTATYYVYIYKDSTHYWRKDKQLFCPFRTLLTQKKFFAKTSPGQQCAYHYMYWL